MPDIDTLSIQIESSATKAIEGIDALEKKLNALLATLNKSGAKNNAGNAIGNIGKQVEKAESTIKKAAVTTSGFGKTLDRVFSFALLKRVGRGIGSFIEKSNEYIEDLNLFTVALGESAQAAQDYANTVGEALGIDPAQWMRGQGVFMTLATGFGVASDRATIMSKNLTQLAYDLSSFYNLPIDQAFKKLESGFAGEIEPVRRLGYDLSRTTLQATAASLGITKLFADMTQAEKSQLRYYALMTQVTQVQGDMARTLIAPANQLRVLKAQLEMAGRSIGNIFIPALNAILPYAIAAAKFVRMIADEIARFFGFELPEIDYSNVNSGIPSITEEAEDMGDAFGGAYDKAKKLKNLLASFDELNIIASESGGGTGGGAGAGVGSGLGGWKDFELPEYDFLSDAVGMKVDAILEKWRKGLEKLKPILKWIKNNFDKILDVITAIGVGILAWKISSKTLSFLEKLGMLKGLNLGKIAAGIGLSVGGFSLAFDGWKEVGNGKATLWSYIKSAIGSALGIAGSLLIFGTGPAGWIIGIGAALTIMMKGVVIGNSERIREEMEADFAAIFSGAIDPDTYVKVISDKFAAISAGLDDGISLRASVESDMSAFAQIEAELDKYRLKLHGVGSLTNEEIEQMNEAFKKLKEVGGAYINDAYALLADGLLTALSVLPEEAHTAVAGYLQELDALKSEDERQLNEFIAGYQNAMAQATAAGAGTPDQERWLKQARDFAMKISLVKQDVIDETVEFHRAINEQGISLADVNFGSVDDLLSTFEGVAKAYSDAQGKINEYWSGVIATAETEMNRATKLGNDKKAGEIAQWIDAYKLSQETQLQELERTYLNETIPFLVNLVSWGESEIKAKAQEEALNVGAVEDFLLGLFLSPEGQVNRHNRNYAAAIDRVAKDFNEQFISPLAESIQASGSPKMAAAADAITDAFTGPNEYAFDPYQIGYYQIGGFDLPAQVEQAINKLEGLTPQMADAGSTLTEGFTSGANQGLFGFASNLTGAISNGFANMQIEADKFARNSGQQIGAALGNGMESEVRFRLNSVGQRVQAWWNKLKPKGVDPSNPFGWGTIEITPFATGGFPTRGSLFLAGEGNGAELVGSIGSQTAVANGDQIISGIANGVAAAEAPQNALLREQNDLLRQILAAQGKNMLVPSAETGRAISRSLDLFAKQRGY